MSDSLPAGLSTPDLDATRWNSWIRQADAHIRNRLDRGEEDTITNLLRFGVTFTQEYRVGDEYLTRFGESSLVDGFAERRADDLIRALGAPNPNAGLADVKHFLKLRGFTLNTRPERARLKAYLLKNLARMRSEFLQAREQAMANRSQMFESRGISLDSNLWPDFDLDLQLRRMANSGWLIAGSVHRVAIIGPGLDFVNKQEGVDYYPPQTVQPFALLDSLLRLKAAKPGAIEIDTLDISARVNAHIGTIRRNASSGRAYTLQLPWFAAGRWTPEFRSQFVTYWQAWGSTIGEPGSPIPVPEAAQGFQTRAVCIRPDLVHYIHPVDMNIVYQAAKLPAAGRFDLIIGTNIFLYYGAFEQSLARRNVAAMLKPGGYLLSNDKLPETVPSGLRLIQTTEIPMTNAPVITDYVYCYRNGSVGPD